MPPIGCNCCEGVTMRLFDISFGLGVEPGEDANGDTGTFIQPTGSTILHGTSMDGYGLLAPGVGRLTRYWVTGTRTDGATSWLHDGTGARLPQTLDHGADTYWIDQRPFGDEIFIVVTGGEPDDNGNTLRAWQVNQANQPYANVWNNGELTKVNAMRIPVFVSDQAFAVGKGNGASVAAVTATAQAGGVTQWTVDPTGGAGEAISIWSPGSAGAWVLFTGTDPNVWLIENDNVISNPTNPGNRVVDSMSVMSGALAIGAGIVGGERTNGHTIEAFTALGPDVINPFGNKQILWTYDTGSTVRGLHTFSTTIAGQLTTLHAAVGDANANGETMWILNDNGNLVTSFKHGASLRAINAADGFASNQLVVCGDRVAS